MRRQASDVQSRCVTRRAHRAVVDDVRGIAARGVAGGEVDGEQEQEAKSKVHTSASAHRSDPVFTAAAPSSALSSNKRTVIMLRAIPSGQAEVRVSE